MVASRQSVLTSEQSQAGLLLTVKVTGCGTNKPTLASRSETSFFLFSACFPYGSAARMFFTWKRERGELVWMPAHSRSDMGLGMRPEGGDSLLTDLVPRSDTLPLHFSWPSWNQPMAWCVCVCVCVCVRACVCVCVCVSFSRS